jgi:hypothetical protein
MHLLSGVGRRVWELLIGDYHLTEDGKMKGTPPLSKKQRKEVSQLIVDSKQSVPLTFSGECKDIDGNPGSFRSVDWIHFARYLLPTVVAEFLQNDTEKRPSLLFPMCFLLLAKRRFTMKRLRH